MDFLQFYQQTIHSHRFAPEQNKQTQMLLWKDLKLSFHRVSLNVRVWEEQLNLHQQGELSEALKYTVSSVCMCAFVSLYVCFSQFALTFFIFCQHNREWWANSISQNVCTVNHVMKKRGWGRKWGTKERTTSQTHQHLTDSWSSYIGCVNVHESVWFW